MYQLPNAIIDEFQIDPDTPVVFPEYLLTDMERFDEEDVAEMIDVYAGELEASLHLAWQEGFISESQMMWLRDYFCI